MKNKDGLNERIHIILERIRSSCRCKIQINVGEEEEHCATIPSHLHLQCGPPQTSIDRAPLPAKTEQTD